MSQAVPLYQETCAELAAVPLERRRAIASGPGGADVHATLFAEFAFLNTAEHRPNGAAPRADGDMLRVVSWNAERCKFLPSSQAMLAALDADVLLLSEMDWGMARSHQAHTPRALAEAFGHSYAFAVEFLELGLGDEREQERHAGEENAVGYHGGAILSRYGLRRPAVVRLESSGAWFQPDNPQRRIGGRIAVLATVELGDLPVTFAAVHLESESAPEERAEQMRVLFDAVDAYAPDNAVAIGGDLNTFSLGVRELMNGERFAEALGEDPARIVHPVPHEPLFDLAADRGYDWETCNVLREPTVRGTSPPPSSRGVQKIDWFLTRGLACSDPVVVDAVDPANGRALSDHEALAVTIAPPAS